MIDGHIIAVLVLGSKSLLKDSITTVVNNSKIFQER